MQAKEMQIEFERRVQIISPDLLIDNKLNSDTIFSYLNAAQDRYVTLNYINDDQLLEDTNIFNRNVEAVKTLYVEKKLLSSGTTTQGFMRFRLPYDTKEEYFLYSSSVSEVTGTYKQLSSTIVIANKLIKPQDLPKYTTTAYNTPIIRQPGCVVMSDATTKYTYLVVATDKYTKINSLLLYYYRRPLKFNTTDGIKKCELPESVHSELVDMAVEMFITEGKYRLQTKQPQEK